MLVVIVFVNIFVDCLRGTACLFIDCGIFCFLFTYYHVFTVFSNREVPGMFDSFLLETCMPMFDDLRSYS